MGSPGPKPVFPAGLFVDAYGFYTEFRRLDDGGRFPKPRRTGKHTEYTSVQMPGEPHIVDALLTAKTADGIQRICNRSLWLRKSTMGHLPLYLRQRQFAQRLVDAKKDRHYPRSPRPTTRLKQLWFLSRALAGALNGVATRTAINLVAVGDPDKMFARPLWEINKMMGMRRKRRKK